MATFELKLEGMEAVMTALKGLNEGATPALREALYTDALELGTEADELVPRDTGTLAASQTVTSEIEDEVVTATVAYGGAASAYALSVHENPRSGQTGGVSPSGQKYKHWATVGQWTYLEQPFKRRTAGFTARIAATLNRILLRSGE
jgi:hypothetical protein